MTGVQFIGVGGKAEQQRQADSLSSALIVTIKAVGLSLAVT